MHFFIAAISTLLLTGTLAAPAELAQRNSRNDQFTTEGMNCWGRVQPGDAAQAQWSIHVTNIDPHAFSPGKLWSQLKKKNVGPVQTHANIDGKGTVAINFSASLASKASHVAQAFANSAGKVDPGCHYYGGEASAAVNAAMDAAAHAAG